MDTMDVYYSRCRLCACVPSLCMDIFSEIGIQMDVKRKIYTYLSIEVEQEDELPKNICFLCLARINEIDKFKTICTETQLTLKNWNQCLDDEDMSFCAEYSSPSGIENTEENEFFHTSLLDTDSNATAASVENPSGTHLEETSSGHKPSAKKRHSNKRNRTEQNSSETLMTKGPSETYTNVNGGCSSAFTRYTSAPSRRKNASHSKNITQPSVQLEEFTASDDDEEVGFPGFVAERHAAEFSYGHEMNFGASSENRMAGEKEQSDNNDDPDCLIDNASRVQFNQTSNEVQTISSAVKEEPGQETYTKYKCSLCHQIFTREPTLKIHLKMHKGKVPYTCPSCKKPFRTNLRLMDHMKAHRNDRYKCADCNMKFSQKTMFIEHTQNYHGSKQQTTRNHKMHKKQKMYCCKHCNASFQDKHSFKDHERCHYGEKPYSCNLCDRRFTQQANLVSHLKVHKNESCICQLCKSSFSTSGQLTEHLLLAHRDVIMEVVNDANPGKQ